MSFALRNLSVFGYCNGFTFWHYKSATDTPAEIASDGYFKDASDMISAGDMIVVSAGAQGLQLYAQPCGDGFSMVPMLATVEQVP
jgi:hypothetical protein